MWNLSFTAPEVIEARVLTRMPDRLRRPEPSDWADANKPEAATPAASARLARAQLALQSNHGQDAIAFDSGDKPGQAQALGYLAGHSPATGELVR